MLVKFFASAGKSPSGMTDYLLGKDRDRSLSKVISGDPEIVSHISEGLDFKNKHTAGCLSFEEKDLPLKDKLEIMAKFEETLLPGLEPEQYAITWIEHTDKGRLELNFHVANVELTTGKRLQPYFDKAHRSKIDDFKQVINHDYHLSNPDDPTKRQAVKQSNAFIQRDVKDVKSEINEVVLSGVESGVIKSREDIIDLLKKSYFEIARETDKSISIKNPVDEKGRNIRLSGEIYERSFYNAVRDQKENAVSIGAESEGIESIRRRLDSKREREAEQNKEKYKAIVVVRDSAISHIDDDSSCDRLCCTKEIKRSLHRTEESRSLASNRGGGSDESGRQDVHIFHNQRFHKNEGRRSKKHYKGGLNELYLKAREYFQEFADRIREFKVESDEREIRKQQIEKSIDETRRTDQLISESQRRISESKQNIEQSSREIKRNSPKKEREMSLGR